MSKIEIGRWSDQLRRMLGMAGQTIVSGDLSPEISPTIQIEGESPEWNFLKSKRDCFGGNEITSSGANTSKFRLRNPLDSGVIAVVEAVGFSTLTTSKVAIRVNAQTIDLSATVIGSVPDSRWGIIGTARAALHLTTTVGQTTAPAGDTMVMIHLLANTPWVFTQKFVLLPGTNIDFGSDSTAVELRAWVNWTERGLPELER